ncbi:TIGR03016 family PEP-CTERM system-associated outer membrane protein [Ferribacterium limneticum]|uniref:TIGR03016 family PEP-CTERM system-associated outer membrane protein n=1 Tax=Ferribacterium limneticum TaxID=76259 RepID=UPI001CF856C2|nr:TIGR03016 family PEP-CTERM system-associated outer membrane protein [Ferribacterium limneticum]UCV24746.1 TIGR03016 family PEP-CTERM system-associated outer membrane protein [Ferribacterium limneticum]
MKNNSVRLSISCCFIIGCLSSTVSAEPREQGARSIAITPRITLTETWSDNVALSSGQNGKESGLITELAPGIRVDAKTTRLKAYFDYAVRGQFYSTSSGDSRTQNSLNTFGTLEAVTNWLFLDFSGMIAQQAISAFGPQSPSGSNINNNSTETSTYRLSPYIRGQIARIVDYSLRYTWSTTQANASAGSNTELSDWAGQLRGSTPFQNLKWSVDATQQTSTFSQGRTSDAERLYAMVTYTVVPQFRISLSGGTESNNYASLNMETHPTHGYGFDWTPTERTAISAFKETRFFGDGHRYSFNHRFPLSSISYSDTKNVSVLPNQFTTVGIGTVYDLFYPLYYQICAQNPQISSLYPDLDTCAKAGISQLPISSNALVTSDFLRSQATVQRNQQLAMAFQGSRNSLTVMFNRNQSQSLLAFAAVNDDFSQNNTTSIRQRGVTISLSHRFSGLTNLSVMASRQESTGAGSSDLKAKTAMYQANLSSPLGAKTTGSISVRHTEFDSSTNPYTENAIIGTVSVIF